MLGSSFGFRSEGKDAAAALEMPGCQSVPPGWRGNSFFNLDLRVAKNIRAREGWNQLIFQGFNVTTKTNYGGNFHNTNTAGTLLTPEGFINPSSSFTPRAFVGEFGFRFTF